MLYSLLLRKNLFLYKFMLLEITTERTDRMKRNVKKKKENKNQQSLIIQK